ncbi:MAG: IS66 family transposase [Anaerolineae bacterium]|nr:IS66 family transposase [Anaerolineae bacterium]
MSRKSKRRRQLEQLDKATLIDDYLLLEQRVETLERQLDELKRALGDKPSKTSSNSSVPPSQEQKGNRKRKKKAKRGPKKGHAGKSRRRQAADETMECRVSTCACCGLDLTPLPQHEAGRHQVIEVPPLRPVVREVVRYGRYCPGCQSYQRAAVPAGYEPGRVVGPQLEGLVLYLHYTHPLSYQRVQTILRDLLDLKLGIGTLVNIVKRGQATLQQGAEAIRQRIQRASVVGSDETGVRVDGHNQWQWVFQTPQWAYYVIRPSRAAQVLTDVMGEAQPQVWISDAYAAQMHHPAHRYQLCLAHQLRDLQYAIDAHACDWATQMQALFRRALRLHQRRGSLSSTRLNLLTQAYRWQLATLLNREPLFEESQRLWRRFHKHRDALLLFLQRDNVPPTNNASEQALRNSVIYRKVTGGFRTPWGADLYANLLSILESARRQGYSIFEILASVFTPNPRFSWIGE